MAEYEVFLQGGSPWGFRLQGGKEFRKPLRISRVSQFFCFILQSCMNAKIRCKWTPNSVVFLMTEKLPLAASVFILLFGLSVSVIAKVVQMNFKFRIGCCLRSRCPYKYIRDLKLSKQLVGGINELAKVASYILEAKKVISK